MARSRLKIALGTALLAAALGLTACGGSSSSGGTPQQGGKASFAELSSAPPNWIFPFIDSAHNSVNSVPQFEYLMYRPLYWFGNGDQPNIDLDLSLAQAPAYSDNNTKVVINLKPYKWSNGESLTPADVQFWMNMMFAEKANWANYVPGEFPDNVKSVTTTGPMQVTFTLDKPYSGNWYTGNELSEITPMPLAWDKTSDSATAGTGGCETSQAKCAAVYQYLYNKSKNEGTYATDPVWQVVDGPWKLKSFTTDGAADFVPNPTYSGPVKPKLDEFDELPFTTDAAEFNVLRGGGTINVGQIPLTDLPIKTDSSSLLPPSNPAGANYNLTNEYIWGWSYTIINYANPEVGPAFKQLYVRQALQETIDQQTGSQVAWRGYAVPTTGPVPTVPNTQYVSASQQNGGPYTFDKAKAKATLTAHGWTEQGGVMTCTSPGSAANQCGDGVPAGEKLNLKLEYASGVTSNQQIVQQWKSDASQAGIDITLDEQPFNTVISDTTSCGSQPSTCGWQMGLFGYETFNSVPTGDGLFLPGAAVNYSSVHDPKLTQLVNTTLTSDNINDFHAYEDYAVQQLPGALNLPDSYFVYAISKSLGGVQAPLNPLGVINPENWYFTK